MNPLRSLFRSRDKPKDSLNGSRYSFLFGGTSSGKPVNETTAMQMTAVYGGLEHLGDKLMKAENFELALDEVVWLITLLANQSTLVHNLLEPDDKRELLTEEAVELLTTPLDLSGYKTAIMEAMVKGTKRYVESEEEPSKNVLVGQATKSCLPD